MQFWNIFLIFEKNSSKLDNDPFKSKLFKVVRSIGSVTFCKYSSLISGVCTITNYYGNDDDIRAIISDTWYKKVSYK